ncbi:hypothetical protein HPPC_06845 [Helicobacter pylori PeCan4]|nr:hypothetical protein HPPC_06845 [Helicobacter pylori PeCan4]
MGLIESNFLKKRGLMKRGIIKNRGFLNGFLQKL